MLVLSQKRHILLYLIDFVIIMKQIYFPSWQNYFKTLHLTYISSESEMLLFLKFKLSSN